MRADLVARRPRRGSVNAPYCTSHHGPSWEPQQIFWRSSAVPQV